MGVQIDPSIVTHPELMPDDHEVAFRAQALFSDDVAHEAHRLRVRDEARKLVAAEKAGAAPPFDAGILSQILARPPEPPYRIEGLIPSNAGTLVTAQRKTGKTTLLLNLTHSLLHGGLFLDRFEVRPIAGRVGYLNFEVSAAQLARWADEAGIDHDGLYQVNLRGRRNPLNQPEDREALATLLRAHQVEILIVDPFSRAYTGLNQNDPGEVAAWLADLDTFARTEAGAVDLVLAAHAGWDGERSRGASSLEDWADSILTIVRDHQDQQTRYMRADGRDVYLEEDRLVFDPTSRQLTLSGTGSRKIAAKARDVADLLPIVCEWVTRHPGSNGTDVERGLREDKVTFQRGDERKALRTAVETGHLEQRPGKGTAKLYYPTGTVPEAPQPSPTGHQDTLPELPQPSPPGHLATLPDPLLYGEGRWGSSTPEPHDASLGPTVGEAPSSAIPVDTSKQAPTEPNDRRAE